MVYFSNKQKVRNIIETVIIPSLKHRDLDYEKTVLALMNETCSQRGVIEEILKSFSDKIEEVRILTLPKEKVIGLIQELREQEQKTEEEIKEVFS